MLNTKTRRNVFLAVVEPKYDDIEKGNGYLSVVLKVSDNTISPVSSSFKSLNKRTLEGKNVKWYYEKKSLRSTSDASDATREGTSEGNSSRVHSNIV